MHYIYHSQPFFFEVVNLIINQQKQDMIVKHHAPTVSTKVTGSRSQVGQHFAAVWHSITQGNYMLDANTGTSYASNNTGKVKICRHIQTVGLT